MDKILAKTKKFFSGDMSAKDNANLPRDKEIYYEGQNTNDRNVTDEQRKESKEKKTNKFFANYNMFF